MRYALVFALVILLRTLTAHADPGASSGLPSAKPVRTVIAQTGEIAATATVQASLTATLADGAVLEMKWIDGGVILSIYYERGDDIESSTQSLSFEEADQVREQIRNAKVCPVDLHFDQGQLTQTKSVCK